MVGDIGRAVFGGILDTLADAHSAARDLVDGVIGRSFLLALPGRMSRRRSDFCFRLLFARCCNCSGESQPVLERCGPGALCLQTNVAVADRADASVDRTLVEYNRTVSV